MNETNENEMKSINEKQNEEILIMSGQKAQPQTTNNKNIKIPVIISPPRAPLARGESISSTASSDLLKGPMKNQPNLIQQTDTNSISTTENISSYNDSIFNDDLSSDIVLSDEYFLSENKHNVDFECGDDHLSNIKKNILTNPIIHLNENEILIDTHNIENEVKQNDEIHYTQPNSVPNFYNNTNRILNLSSNQLNNENDDNNMYNMDLKSPSSPTSYHVLDQFQRSYNVTRQMHLPLQQEQKFKPQQQHSVRSSKRKFIVIPANSPTSDRSMSPVLSNIGKSSTASTLTPLSYRLTQLQHQQQPTLASTNTSSLSSISMPYSMNSMMGNSIVSGSSSATGSTSGGSTGTGNNPKIFKNKFLSSQSSSTTATATGVDHPSVNFIVNDNNSNYSHSSGGENSDNFNTINQQYQHHHFTHPYYQHQFNNDYQSQYYNTDLLLQSKSENPNNESNANISQNNYIVSSPIINQRKQQQHENDRKTPVFIVGDDENLKNDDLTDDKINKTEQQLITTHFSPLDNQINVQDKQQIVSNELNEQQKQLKRVFNQNNNNQQELQNADEINQNKKLAGMATTATINNINTKTTTTNVAFTDNNILIKNDQKQTEKKIKNSLSATDFKTFHVNFIDTNNLLNVAGNNTSQQHLNINNPSIAILDQCQNKTATNSLTNSTTFLQSDSTNALINNYDVAANNAFLSATNAAVANHFHHYHHCHLYDGFIYQQHSALQHGGGYNNFICNCNSNFPTITNSLSHNALGGMVNYRPKKNQNISMRSVVSAHIPDRLADQYYQQMSLQTQSNTIANGNSNSNQNNSPHHNLYQNRILRTSSYIFDEKDKCYQPQTNTIAYLTPPIGSHFGGKIFSDANSVRSLASIGVGSTDGTRLVIKHVPNSPTELLKIVNPPPQQPPVDDDDESSIWGYPFDPERSQLKPRRQHWANKMQFVLACIGYSVGLGNVWRFPYMCYKSGGGAFLVPYFIILIICSTPMLYMELAVGQYTGRGPIAALGQICPLFKGAGLASVIVSFLMSTYYSVIIGYSIYYFFTSMKTDLPWTGCNHRWNTPSCWMPEREQANITKSDSSRTPSEEFFTRKVLQISTGIEDPGTMRWELFACLICAWLLVYFATWKSIKSSAKVRYFTATFPFFLIIVLMGRALTLEGAETGLQYFFRPKWSDLGNANIWINAASQNFNSLGIAFGSMISFASYNKYNNNILQDTLAVSIVNAITSILVGIFAFATLGNLALEQKTDIEDVISDGPGFIFVVYPQVMAKMPYAQLWGVMFFFMLLCLGLNSQFAIVEVVVTSLRDGFPNWIKRKLMYHEVLVLIVCIISFLFGLPNIIQAGMFFFQLMDHYAASISIMFVAFFQMIAIAWCYGAGRLSKNVKQMTGKAPAYYLKTCWVLCGPVLLISLWIFSLINYKEPTYDNGKYVYPRWAYGMGWTIASLSLVCIPAYAIINIARADGKNLCDKILNAMKPNIYQCKICGEHHCEHDFPEEAFIIHQEMTPLPTPKIILRSPPPGHPVSKQHSPLLTNTNQPNTSVVEDESSCGPSIHYQYKDETVEKS